MTQKSLKAPLTPTSPSLPRGRGSTSPSLLPHTDSLAGQARPGLLALSPLPLLPDRVFIQVAACLPYVRHLPQFHLVGETEQRHCELDKLSCS